MDKEFNLLYEPWILVRLLDGQVKELSLLEVFKQAHEIKGLAGELPTQDIAVLRLLLAIMHATIADTWELRDCDDALGVWQELWEAKELPYEEIDQYLKKYEDRFWLFHPETPFYQVADLDKTMQAYKKSHGNKADGEEKLKKVARLIGDLSQSDNQQRLFAGKTGLQQDSLKYNEAARWLLHLQGFDDDSAKKPTPKGTGYLGKLGLLCVIGSSLFETIMLNLVLLDAQKKPFADAEQASRAYWEKPVCKLIENLIPQPNAQKELLTMNSRRIQLIRNGEAVVGYLLTMGDYYLDTDILNEQMTVFKIDKDGIKAKRHNPNKQIWRDFSSLIITKNQQIEPGLIRWLRYLEENGVKPKNIFNIYIAGVHYELKGAGWQIVGFVEDGLKLNAGILTSMSAQWNEEIIEWLTTTDEAVKQLGWFAVNIIGAEGNSGDNKDKEKVSARTNAQEICYSHLDHAFREWLLSIDGSSTDYQEKMREWYDMVKEIIFADGDRMFNQCSDKALIGFIKRDGDMEKSINVFDSYNKFRVSVNKILG